MIRIDNKTLIGWAIIILIAVFSTASNVRINGINNDQNNDQKISEKIQQNNTINATQQLEINELKESFKSQDQLLRELNNNVIIIMHDRGLDPVNHKK